MTRLIPRWSGADPDLAWLMRLNFVALTVSFVVLGAAYALGFRHTAVVVDLVAMVVAEALLLASLPLTRQFGNVACILALTLSATAFSVAGTWSTPNLVALTTILMLIPLLVGFPYVSRGWLYALMANAVIGSASLAALSEWRRVAHVNENWVVNAVVIASALPGTYLIVIFLVRNAYHRLQEQSDQLRQSRTRVVEVADAARRSLERDLHDGAQQRLLAMSVTMERARKEMSAGHSESAEALLLQLSHENHEVLLELRELARGVYPPLLTERGLVAAIQSAARRSVVPVTLDVESFPRPAQQIEVAAYFCIMEALTNAAKHSGATDLHITVRGTPRLTFTVSDNGRGFDPGSVSTGGLLGMEARAAAAGGTIVLDTAPGRGTSLTGTFPLDAQVNDR
jgi:signal transduction histidine kinase